MKNQLLGDNPRKSGPTGSLWCGGLSAIDMAQDLQGHWESEETILTGGRNPQSMPISMTLLWGSHHKYLILFLLLWVTTKPLLQELTPSVNPHPFAITFPVFFQWGTTIHPSTWVKMKSRVLTMVPTPKDWELPLSAIPFQGIIGYDAGLLLSSGEPLKERCREARPA